MSLIVSSTPHELEPLIEHGLYDILFSEYFYFFQFPVKKAESAQSSMQNLYNETSALQKLTASILRDSVLAFIKHTATRGSSNIKEIRKLTEVLGEHSNEPVVLMEIGACLVDIFYYQREITQSAFSNLKGICIISHIITNLQKKIVEIEREKPPKSSIDHAVDAEIGSPISLDPLHTKIIYARNILLYLFDILICGEHQQALALEDINTLKCLFSCLTNYHLSDFALVHLKGLLDTQVDDSSCFEVILSQIVDIFPVLVGDGTDESIQLLMRILSVIQEAFDDRNRGLLQAQIRDKLDRFTSLLKIQKQEWASTVTLHEFCIQAIKTLTSLLAENEKLKVLFRENIGYDLLRDHILLCENNKPSGEIFNELFNMLVDGAFDMNYRYRITNPGVVKVMFQLCQYCSDLFVGSFLSQFTTIILKCVHNRNACCSVSLISILLDMIPRFDDSIDHEQTTENNKSANISKYPEILNYLIKLIEEIGKQKS